MPLVDETDGLTIIGQLLSRYPAFEQPITTGDDEETWLRLRRAETVGRAVGDRNFL